MRFLFNKEILQEDNISRQAEIYIQSYFTLIMWISVTTGKIRVYLQDHLYKP